MITKLREWVYRFGWIKPIELPAFVISVGNLSMGGTGKSPMVMLLADWAKQKSIKTAVLSRGYKRKSRRLQIILPGEKLPPAEEIGDEPWMIRHRCAHVAMLVHPDRARMAKRHWAELDQPQLILLDDGFQHWRVKRDKDILLIDATDSLRAMPFGRLREGVSALRRADLIILTKVLAVPPARRAALLQLVKKLANQKADAPWKKNKAVIGKIPVLQADYSFSGYFSLENAHELPAPPPGQTYLLLSGIAKPDHFRAMAHSLGLNIQEELYFPDHHILSEKDKKMILHTLSNLKNGALLLNEKDWSRWKDFLVEAKLPGLGIRVRYDFLEGSDRDFQEFLQGIEKCFI